MPAGVKEPIFLDLVDHLKEVHLCTNTNEKSQRGVKQDKTRFAFQKEYSNCCAEERLEAPE